jgi:nucleotide-binding universal stress UspA family protein
MSGRVVVGVDGSDASLQALAWARQQAEVTGAGLEVVVAWEPVALPYGWSMDGVPAVVDDFNPAEIAERVAADSVAKVLGDASGDVKTTVVEGHPATVLVEASADADLLVVGSSGHGAFVGMLLGSVSAHCAQKAHCPVVITRPEKQPHGGGPRR